MVSESVSHSLSVLSEVAVRALDMGMRDEDPSLLLDAPVRGAAAEPEFLSCDRESEGRVGM